MQTQPQKQSRGLTAYSTQPPSATQTPSAIQIPIRRALGYSLMELLISLALVVVLIAVAAPSFASFISRTEVATQASALHQSLHLARGAALARQQVVQICQSEKGSDTCSADYSSNRSWANGWIVFADQNGNNQLDGNDEIIRQVTLETTNGIIFNQRGRLRFFPDGSARSAGFYICDKLEQAFKHIYLLHSGRARITSQLKSQHRNKCKASLN